MAGKLDPTVDQLCFRMVENNGNEFRGSKNGGNEVWVGLRWPKNTKIQGPKFAATAAFAGPIRAHPAAAGQEILPAAASRRPPPPWPSSVQGGWLDSPPTFET